MSLTFIRRNIILIILLLFCKIMVYSQSIDSIKYGSGGGFSGLMTYYKIKPKEVFRGVGKVENIYQDKAKISSRKIKLLFKNLASNIISFPNYIYPNNQYAFIKIYAGQNEYKAVWDVWDMNDKKIPENLKIIEKKINAFINNLKFVPND
jgi:hypothetical protein